MFEDYLNELQAELEAMSDSEFIDTKRAHEKDPEKAKKDYWEHVDRRNDAVFPTTDQCGDHYDALCDEYDGEDVDAVYQSRFDSTRAVLLHKKLDQTLPVKSDDKPRLKI